LADELDIKIDKSVDRDDVKTAAKTAKEWKGPGNVVCLYSNKSIFSLCLEIRVFLLIPSPTAILTKGEILMP
jgi:hypothetical protein